MLGIEILIFWRGVAVKVLKGQLCRHQAGVLLSVIPSNYNSVGKPVIINLLIRATVTVTFF